jgi:YhcG PDDEXK nuclease domain
LVAIDLKLGKFSAENKGQIELYLRWLDRYERKEWEEAPIELILSSDKNQEQIELLQFEEGQIRVAEYWTELLPKPILEQKLHQAILRGRSQLRSSP